VLTRTIVEHDEWFVPMLAFEGRDQFGTIVMPPDGRLGTVPNELWMFSDRAAVDLAPQQLGYGSMSGVELASNLSPAWQQAQINPGTPDYLTVQLPPLVRGQLSQMARAVPLERKVDAVGDGALHDLVRFPSYYIAITGGQPVTVPSDDGLIARAIVVFTAADSVDRLLARVPQQNQANIAIQTIAGPELLRNVGGSPIDGVLITRSDRAGAC